MELEIPEVIVGADGSQADELIELEHSVAYAHGGTVFDVKEHAETANGIH